MQHHPRPVRHQFLPDILPLDALLPQTPHFLRVVPLGARNDDAHVGVLTQELLVETDARLLVRAPARFVEELDQNHASELGALNVGRGEVLRDEVEDLDLGVVGVVEAGGVEEADAGVVRMKVVEEVTCWVPG
jgi:hypothetical protein